MQRRFFLSLVGLTLAGSLRPAVAGTPVALASPPSSVPSLMLANVYRSGIVLADYWVSEKFDGVRGYWDGQALWTRGGERVAAPAWFTAGWPNVAMDGELWAGHGQFPKAVSTVRQQTPDDAAWRSMRFMVFDLPAHGGPFTERIPALNGVVSRIDQHWVQAVEQFKVASPQALQTLLSKTVKNGGEGLMLHRGASLYKGQRNDDLLKLKTHDDSEARVVAHVPGQGKYAGKLGALLVEMPAADGKPAQRFKLGTGFSDAQRQNPPAVGTRITYRFRGLNDSGIPRFASFMRVRED
ncbi:DNA ligase [Polaromonas naphthalenivorans]|uniref:ATP dependent DNA ligase n=1 Tax=Polaromonas naphthalenivorans (strain CJ2) TaxID=365044 RepID=A1VNV0_POLNA|nr:DNA ligase [Polaromonas naphthalenivorans]ABM37328.1 ATP dependent DNA ligase [Polaromonas naphthalenivorans CJ2]